ncbi:MAG: hypothetical protein J6Y48_10750 [Clostridia bacterium]|nr:hypothetical protein [Clostridia bacterium]
MRRADCGWVAWKCGFDSRRCQFNRGDRMANVVINYQPTPKQAMFHASKANEILYGGAAGGGKRRRSSWMRCFAA